MAFLNTYLPKAQQIKIDNSLYNFTSYWKLLQKSKNTGFQGIISAWNYFKPCSILNSRKCLKKEILYFLELHFVWSTFPAKEIYYKGKLVLEFCYKEGKLKFQNNKDIHDGCTKTQKYIVAGCIKGFLIY